MQLRLKDQVALVTGGGTGIGRATANLLAREGASVVVTGRRPEFIQEAVEEITVEKGRALAICGDVAKHSDANRMVQETVEKFGRLDILVNNAGVFRSGPLETVTDETVDLLIDVNLRGIISLTRAAIPELRKTRGSIINVSSALAIKGSSDCAVYSATKAAVEGLTRALAVELSAQGVRVNAVAPAVVETPIFETVMPKEAVAGALQGMTSFQPLGRNGRPEEIAEAILFLASPVSAWTTGAILRIDGGATAS